MRARLRHLSQTRIANILAESPQPHLVRNRLDLAAAETNILEMAIIQRAELQPRFPGLPPGSDGDS